ncbi:MAG: UDP-2,3-diacylglucosamine diphosphatase [Rubricoccaceae bacterium]
MTLFVSDLHLGRGSSAQTRAAERDFAALLEAHEDALLGEGQLVLLGDVFNHYIEYRHLVPRVAVRLAGLLAQWAARGARITYVTGNRDLWHLDFFEREIGVRLVRHGAPAVLEGHRTYIAHGDGFVPSERVYNRLQPLFRSSAMAQLFRMGLPGDSAYGFAQWVARRFGTDGVPQARAAAEVRAAAARLLARPDVDLAILGHSHTAVCEALPGGTYLNTGYWFGARHFACLTPEGPALFRWTGTGAEPLPGSLAPAPLTAAS